MNLVLGNADLKVVPVMQRLTNTIISGEMELLHSPDTSLCDTFSEAGLSINVKVIDSQESEVYTKVIKLQEIIGSHGNRSLSE